MILYQIHAIKENKMNRRKIDCDTAWSNQFWFSNEEDALSYCKTMQQKMPYLIVKQCSRWAILKIMMRYGL